MCHPDDDLEIKTTIEELIAENEAITAKSEELIEKNKELIIENEALIAKNQDLKARLRESTPAQPANEPPKHR